MAPFVMAFAIASLAIACAAPASREANIVWIEPTRPEPRASAAPPPSSVRPRAAPRDGPLPHHFWVLLMGEVAERRTWLRVDPSTWEERYPSGAVMRYRVVGRLSEAGRSGVVARRLPDGDVEVFVPELGSIAWPAMRVTPDGDWHELGPMHLID
jgi:hypothetical protein